MSNSFHAFAGDRPTGIGRLWKVADLSPWLKLAEPALRELPFEYGVDVPLRQAYSHSASVGKRFPSRLQYSNASYQVTSETGQLGQSMCLLGSNPITFLKSSLITSNLSI